MRNNLKVGEKLKSIGYFFSTKSMMKGSPEEAIPSSKEAYSVYFKMAWPCVLEALLLCMVNVIDTMMVGTLGTNAIAAVGITSQPKFLLLALTFAMNTGIISVIARRKGADDRKGANIILQGALIAAIIIGVSMAILGIVFAEPLLRFMGAEESYLPDAIAYFQIISFGLFFQTLNLVINAAQRGVGNTRITMVTNTTANVINVIFNYILINGKFGFPRLEVQGAAWATNIGAMVACAIAITTLLRRNGYLNIYEACKERVTFFMFKPVFQVGSSAFVEQVFLRVGFMLYAMIVAKLGTNSYATHQICMTLLNISFSFGDGIGIAASALVGQQLGARRVDLAKMYGGIGQRMAFVASTFVALFFFLGRNFLIGLYTEDPAIILIGGNILIIMAVTTHMQTAQVVSNGCLRGAGDSKYVAKISLISVAILRPLITYLLCFRMGLDVYGAWISLFIDQLFRLICAVRRFEGGEWSKIKL